MTEDPKARLLRLADARREAQERADQAGAELRAAVRELVDAGDVRPAEIARWLDVTPQYINKILKSQR